MARVSRAYLARSSDTIILERALGHLPRLSWPRVGARDDADRSGQPERNRDERDGCDVRDNRPLWDDSLGG